MILLEDMKNRFKETVRELCEFLGVNISNYDDFGNTKQNVSRPSPILAVILNHTGFRYILPVLPESAGSHEQGSAYDNKKTC